jgi:hypothetical protein
MLNVARYSMEVKALFKRIGVQPHVIELDHLGLSPFSPSCFPFRIPDAMLSLTHLN